MILSTHAVVGASVASLVTANPAVGFLVGVITHYSIDMIPHWDYEITSSKRDEENPMNNDMVLGRAFVFDIFRINFDFILGLVVALGIFYYMYNFSWMVVLAGALGGVMPDPLQFVYFKFRREPMISIQKFHNWIHTRDNTFRNRWLLGGVLQVLLCVAVVLLVVVF